MRIAYVIGRFQPFHIGHQALIDKALEIADRVVVVLGDTGCKPDFRNPWTPLERVNMISAVYRAQIERMNFVAVEDVPYDDHAWKTNVMKKLAAIAPVTWVGVTERFLVGHKKDASSFYLDMFPEWQYVEAEQVKNIHVFGETPIDGTELRWNYFGLTGGVWNWKYHVPAQVDEFMRAWARRNRKEYERIRKERAALVDHKVEWTCEATRKYGAPTHATVDTLLESPESILLVRRKGDIGNGALAIPGGFVEPHERLFEAALRELSEETGIRLTVPRQHLVPFDHPKRSLNGRVITNVLHIKTSHEHEVKAGDDAADALWVRKEDLPRLKREFFADHYHIVQHFIKETA